MVMDGTWAKMTDLETRRLAGGSTCWVPGSIRQKQRELVLYPPAALHALGSMQSSCHAALSWKTTRGCNGLVVLHSHTSAWYTL